MNIIILYLLQAESALLVNILALVIDGPLNFPLIHKKFNINTVDPLFIHFFFIIPSSS